MKKIFLILLITLELSLIKIPPYKELNNIAIIEMIAIEKMDGDYLITLKEIIPIKADQGIDYEYKYYNAKSTNLSTGIEKLTKSTKKKLYLNKVKFLITNINNTNQVIEELNIKPKTIIHTNNVSDKIN